MSHVDPSREADLGCAECVAEAIRSGQFELLRELLALPVAYSDAVYLPDEMPRAIGCPATSGSGSRCAHPPQPDASPLNADIEFYFEQHEPGRRYWDSIIRLAPAAPSTVPLQFLIASGKHLHRPAAHSVF